MFAPMCNVTGRLLYIVPTAEHFEISVWMTGSTLKTNQWRCLSKTCSPKDTTITHYSHKQHIYGNLKISKIEFVCIYRKYYQSLGIQIKNRFLCISAISGLWAIWFPPPTSYVCSFSYNHLTHGITPGLFVQWSRLHHQRANTKCVSGFIEEKVSIHSGRSHPLSAGEWGAPTLDYTQKKARWRTDTETQTPHLRNHHARRSRRHPPKQEVERDAGIGSDAHVFHRAPLYFHHVRKLC